MFLGMMPKKDCGIYLPYAFEKVEDEGFDFKYTIVLQEFVLSASNYISNAIIQEKLAGLGYHARDKDFYTNLFERKYYQIILE